MSSILHHISDEDLRQLPDASSMRFAIVVSEWNSNITGVLLEDCRKTLLAAHTQKDHIRVETVPGSFELVYGCSRLVQSGLYDAVIALGCVIQGDTPHFDYICRSVTQGITTLNTQGKVPVVFGVLTTFNLEQAEERINGKVGRKGEEFALTAIKMAAFALSTRE